VNLSRWERVFDFAIQRHVSTPLAFASRPAIKTRSERIPLLASYQYRGHIIRVEVEQNPDTLHWQARGAIEISEGKTFRTFVVNGTSNTFKTEAEAKHALLQQAKRWVYDQVGS
jgi:hypothetical protein